MKKTLFKSVVALIFMTAGMTGCSSTTDVTENGGATWETGSESSRSRDSDSASAGEGGVPTGEPLSEDAGGEYESGGGYGGDDSAGNGQDLGPGILTAGSFDDGLNLDIFDAFWKTTSLKSLKLEVDGVTLDGATEVSEWARLKPQKRRDSALKLDLALVIDTTGSMGDELEYLQTEIHSIADTVSDHFPDVIQRYGLIVYRDEGDDYVTRGMWFTPDLDQFHDFLSLQSSEGGGDYPEAMHTALAEASTKLDWDEDDLTAKILFLVADAPPHDQDEAAAFSEVLDLRKKGVVIYPVAASGVGEEAEAVLRTSALLTGGQYIFLTDDSGVGNSHAEPHFPCYFVERLNETMMRMIESEISGKRIFPEEDQIIRTVGYSVDGVCQQGANL